MTNQKVFCKKDGLVLLGDERDIMLPAQYKLAVLSWCRKNSVIAEMPLNKDNQQIARHYFGMDIWRIRNDQQRMWFALRWS